MAEGDMAEGDIVYACWNLALQDVKATGVTLHGYMGRDSVEPFLKDPRCGVFLLCKTSNPSSNEVQTLSCVGKDGKNRYGPVSLHDSRFLVSSYG